LVKFRYWQPFYRNVVFHQEKRKWYLVDHKDSFYVADPNGTFQKNDKLFQYFDSSQFTLDPSTGNFYCMSRRNIRQVNIKDNLPDSDFDRLQDIENKLRMDNVFYMFAENNILYFNHENGEIKGFDLRTNNQVFQTRVNLVTDRRLSYLPVRENLIK
jgi:hypothetical protein